MQKIRHSLNLAIVLSELSHVFCCVLPTVFSFLTLLVGFGLISAMPVFLQDLHGFLHEYELPVIAASGLMILLGWAFHAYSVKVDCHSTGCAHEPCQPVKKRASRILQIATLLFVVNITVYGVLHRGFGIFVPETAHEAHEESQIGVSEP